ncbi:MAG: N-acetylmuramoyl-L-alanine amidase [Hormoscilla sp. GM7CHS1pb]|nr:N-acetylmuramoyl-L-alanine amidase [Hormoscilla sp. GM7CHS1pb]
MEKIIGLATLGTVVLNSPAWAEQPLFVVYPPAEHETTAPQIFLIGTAPTEGEVLVNGNRISRSRAGHFAPSFPLQLGENIFILRYQDQELQIKVTRKSTAPPVPVGMAFAEGSLKPAVDIARMPGDRVCFGAIAPTNAQVSVQLGNEIITLGPQPQDIQLPPNSAVLTGENQPNFLEEAGSQYTGCTALPLVENRRINLGQPRFQLRVNDRSMTQLGPGKISVLSGTQFEIAEVIVDSGTARTGPSTNYSRLTPLPKGTRSAITGREGEWLRLDYGAWIRSKETRILSSSVPPTSLIRSVRARQKLGWTEVLFPLQVPVPVSVEQRTDSITLSLYNTTAQTDTIFFNDDPLIARLDWQQASPTQLKYIFEIKGGQQWGYKLRYEGTTLILSLRHPPQVKGRGRKPLSGMRILLDPGHGSENDLGARGPNGYPEKDVALIISQLLAEQLRRRGATVIMTREGDDDLWPHDRVEIIERTEPDLALSLHYNALPDSGDAIGTAGIGSFWYHPQAHSLAVFLHNYLVAERERPSYGVFWNNLALTRPSVAPAVLLELGFMINPVEFEWIVNSREQKKLAHTLADGIVQWVKPKLAKRSLVIYPR